MNRAAFTSVYLLSALLAGSAGAQGELREYASNEGAFAVMVPEAPVRSIAGIESPAGRLVLAGFEGPLGGGRYQITYRDYPESYVRTTGKDRILDAARDAAVGRGHLVVESGVALGKLTGRSLKIETVGELVLTVRLFLSGTRLYELRALAPPARAADPVIRRFLDSFRLLPRTASDWQPVESKEGGFSFEAPAAPSRSRQSITSVYGPTVLFSLTANVNGSSFVASYNDYASLTDVPASEVLDTARNGAVASLKGKLQGERDVTLQGNPGREVTIEAGTMRFRARVYLVGNRLYQVVAAVPQDRLDPTEVTRFLDSFKLIQK